MSHGQALRFPVAKPMLLGREQEYVNDALQSGWISGAGSYVPRFEQACSTFLGLPGGIAVTNGTAGLHLACLAMGLGPEMDVVVPSLTYVATANAVAYTGARPHFADCDPHTLNATVETIEAAWTPKTVGVIAVHLYGLPSPVDEIAALCESRGAWLIEDCAESFGATIGKRPTGSFGNAAVFSFYGNKIISTGEGGLVFAQQDPVRETIRQLRGQGVDTKRTYFHSRLGYNYRMTNLCGAIGLGQVEMAAHHVAERRRVGRAYDAHLAAMARRGLLQLPASVPRTERSCWLYTVLIEDGGRERRDAIIAYLRDRHGIETRPVFIPMTHLPMYEGSRPTPIADSVSARGLSLPAYTGLTESDVAVICAAVEEALASNA